MSFLERRPAGRLRGIVDRFWRVDEAACDQPSLETICPDGRTEIVLHLGDPMRQDLGDRRLDQPRSLLVAQMDGPITIVPAGRVSMVGARLVAGALHRLLPVPQDRLAGQILDLESFWRSWARSTADRVASEPSAADSLNTFERALEALVSDAPADAGTQSMEAAIATLRASGGNAPIDRLAHATALSRRQFERRFAERVGLSPRLFGRIVRFQRALRHLGHESGADVAARCGYADQAHLVREIRRFAGRTPSALTQPDGLTAFFVS
jgi:AraC-like DNA-binding protein